MSRKVMFIASVEPRAGAAGIAWSFCDRSERPYLEDIKRLIRANIPLVEQIPNLPKLAPLSAQDLRAAASADAPHRNRSRKPSPQNRSKTQDRTDAARRPARHNERPGGQVRAADRPAPRQAVKPVAKAGPKRRPKHAGKAGTKAVTDHAKAPKKETKGALRMEKSGQNLGKSRRRGPSKPGQRPRKPGTPPCPEEARNRCPAPTVGRQGVRSDRRCPARPDVAIDRRPRAAEYWKPSATITKGALGP